MITSKQLDSITNEVRHKWRRWWFSRIRRERKQQRRYQHQKRKQ